MALFERRSSGRSGDGDPDQDFPFLTVGQAARLRSLTRDAFAEQGVETAIEGDHLQAADGHQYGLHNLFATCHAAPRGERSWRGTVREHVARMVRLQDQPAPADLPAAEVLAHAFVRVCGTSTLPSLDLFGYHRTLGGDLVELLAFDTDEAVTFLTDDVVDRIGGDALRAAGVDHLLAEPFGEVAWLDAPGNGRFAVLLGESVYTASRVLTMDDVLRRVLGELDAANGVLVSVPNRHQLTFHVPSDGRLLAALEGMIRFTMTGFADGVGGVSPHVFWRPPSGGALEQRTAFDGDGTVSVQVRGAFAGVVERLGARPPS
jgi:hypothetical protein